MTDKVREEFESSTTSKWSDSFSFAKNENGEYRDTDVHYLWQGFQMGRASLARQVPMVAINVILSQFKADQFNAFMRVRGIDLVKSFLSTVEELRK